MKHASAVFGLVNSLVEKCARLNERSMSERDEKEQESLDRRVAQLQAEIEGIAALAGLRTMWPGLYPLFENKKGIQFDMGRLEEVFEAITDPKLDYKLQIQWAYPSSTAANRFGFGKSGCFVVEKQSVARTQELAGFATREEAETYMATL